MKKTNRRPVITAAALTPASRNASLFGCALCPATFYGRNLATTATGYAIPSHRCIPATRG
jgi:hypothetical protein